MQLTEREQTEHQALQRKMFSGKSLTRKQASRALALLRKKQSDASITHEKILEILRHELAKRDGDVVLSRYVVVEILTLLEGWS